jgi:hypothetical protein
VARRFAAAFERKDATLDTFVQPQWGFFVLYNLGVSVSAFHFRSFAEVFEGENGFGYLKRESLDCTFEATVEPIPRPVGRWPWDCEEDVPAKCFIGPAGETSWSQFGSGDPLYLADNVSADARAELLALLREHLQEAILGVSATGGMGTGYLFRKAQGTWRLVVIDRVDVCSA